MCNVQRNRRLRRTQSHAHGVRANDRLRCGVAPRALPGRVANAWTGPTCENQPFVTQMSQLLIIMQPNESVAQGTADGRTSLKRTHERTKGSTQAKRRRPWLEVTFLLVCAFTSSVRRPTLEKGGPGSNAPRDEPPEKTKTQASGRQILRRCQKMVLDRRSATRSGSSGKPMPAARASRARR